MEQFLPNQITSEIVQEYLDALISVYVSLDIKAMLTFVSGSEIHESAYKPSLERAFIAYEGLLAYPNLYEEVFESFQEEFQIHLTAIHRLVALKRARRSC